MDPREKDEFNRIRRYQKLDRIDEVFAGYWQSMSFFRAKAIEHAREIGRIDERLERSP